MVLEYILEDEGAVPSVARVADAAGLSPRSLQRRLQQEQHSFKSLLDQVRQAQAQRLIAESAETVTSVADRLGYAQPTSLNRAMLRWTGRSRPLTETTGPDASARRPNASPPAWRLEWPLGAARLRNVARKERVAPAFP